VTGAPAQVDVEHDTNCQHQCRKHGNSNDPGEIIVAARFGMLPCRLARNDGPAKIKFFIETKRGRNDGVAPHKTDHGAAKRIKNLESDQ
jgi:hypothetical protein